MNQQKFYITTTLPYVNADPHIGFALEIVQADALARFKRLLGYEVIFNTGTDEHGLKIYRKAAELGVDPLTYCDQYAAEFHQLKDLLNLTYTHFIRTTNPVHKQAAQEFWKKCALNGDIYKKNYQVKYCVGCELEKTDSELTEGKCPLHPTTPIELINEENYFFRFSKYQEALLQMYEKNPFFVQPEHKFNEIKKFVAGGLVDFSISRLKEKMPWGVEVPDDETQVMYVWFDALVNYISTLGWPTNHTFDDWWPGTQVAGKDNLRQQSAMWQAMLMSANIPNSRQIFIHGFITSGGQKMSKSVGNVVNPAEIVKKYGTDALRYYLLREIPALEDGDFAQQRMDQLYTSDLANELGNLVMRLTTLAEKDNLIIEQTSDLSNIKTSYSQEMINLFHDYNFSQLLEKIWITIKELNKKIDQFTPWKKTSDERRDFLIISIQHMAQIGKQLQPFIPHTATKIIEACQGKIQKIAPLFPRISP